MAVWKTCSTCGGTKTLQQRNSKGKMVTISCTGCFGYGVVKSK